MYKRNFIFIIMLVVIFILTGCEDSFEMESDIYSLSYFNEVITIKGFKEGISEKEIVIESEVTYYCKKHKKNEKGIVNRVGEHAFDNLDIQKLSFIVNDKTDFRQIMTYAFANNPNLEISELPSTLDEVQSYAFYNCEKIDNLNLMNIKSIQASAFENCYELKNIIIGSEIREIGNNAFKNCNDNLVVNILNSTPPTLGNNVFYGVENLIIKVPKGSKSTYQSDGIWFQYKKFIIESD